RNRSSLWRVLGNRAQRAPAPSRRPTDSESRTARRRARPRMPPPSAPVLPSPCSKLATTPSATGGDDALACRPRSDVALLDRRGHQLAELVRCAREGRDADRPRARSAVGRADYLRVIRATEMAPATRLREHRLRRIAQSGCLG